MNLIEGNTAEELVINNLIIINSGLQSKWRAVLRGGCITEVDNTLNAILKDPVLIVEGMAQEASDTVEEKGIAYGVGFVGGSVLADIFVSKGIGKLKVLNKADDATRVASKTDEAGKIIKNF